MVFGSSSVEALFLRDNCSGCKVAVSLLFVAKGLDFIMFRAHIGSHTDTRLEDEGEYYRQDARGRCTGVEICTQTHKRRRRRGGIVIKCIRGEVGSLRSLTESFANLIGVDVSSL